MPLDPRLARGGLVAIRRVTVSTVARVLNFLDANPPNQSPTQAIRHSSDKDPAVRRLIQLLKPHAPGGGSAAGAGTSSESALTGDDAIAFTIACAYPELIARRVSPGSDRVLTVGGTGAILPRGGHGGGARSHGGGHSGRSGVSISANDEWLAIADIGRSESASARASGTGAIIRSAMPISRELAFVAAGGVLRERTATYDLDTRKVHAREVTALGAIELSSAPAKPTAAESEAAVAAALAEHGAEMLQLSKNATALIRRMQYLHDAGVAGYPDLRKPWPTEVTTFAAADIAAGRRPDVCGLLRGLIPWDGPIDELAPEELTLPNGRTRRLTYPQVDVGIGGADTRGGGGESDGGPSAGGVAGAGAGGVASAGGGAEPESGGGATHDGVATGGDSATREPVVLATKLQDVFGLNESPEIAGQRIQFHLLSPAGRPLAVTDDLASFWAGPYQGVRKDMRGRYPKHAWPEDPRRSS